MPSEEYKERKKNYIQKYQKEHYKLIAIRCRRDSDKDILDILKNSGNASEYCKRAIRYYAENGGK